MAFGILLVVLIGLLAIALLLAVIGFIVLIARRVGVSKAHPAGSTAATNPISPASTAPAPLEPKRD